MLSFGFSLATAGMVLNLNLECFFMHPTFDKIICVGKNYLDHALELGDGVPEEPIFFFKPPSCLVASQSQKILLPRDRGSVHHECEIVYRIRRKDDGFFFDSVTLGLDLTLRDLQTELKE